MRFLGWEITYHDGPFSGSQCWRAERFGVTMCANTKEALKEMILQRAKRTE